MKTLWVDFQTNINFYYIRKVQINNLLTNGSLIQFN